VERICDPLDLHSTRISLTEDDPVAEYLPASVKVPEFQGKPITLLDLATYTSGLPNMPDNFVSKDELDHWAAARPAWVRSRIKLRSNSASAPNM
jgi:CubicO group peptidase (beta-lactamase class C family)